MAAGIAVTLVIMGVVGFVMMQSDSQETDVVNPAGDEQIETQESPDAPRGSGDQDSGALMPVTRDEEDRVQLVNASGAEFGPGQVRHAATSDSEAVEAITAATEESFVFETWEQFNEHVQPSVVRIDVESASGGNQGSGFVLDAQGVIATNYHVIGGADEITVTFHDRSEVPVEGYVHLDSNKDIALLKINPVQEGLTLKPLPLMRDEPRTGAEVAAFGTPHGFDFTFSPGNISGYRSPEEMKHPDSPIREGNWVQHTAAISKGSSGGPLVSRNAEVVAMNTLYVSEAQNLNFGISSGDLRSAISSQTVLIPVSPQSAPGVKIKKRLDGENFGLVGYTVLDDARTVLGREKLGQLTSLSVNGQINGNDPRHVVEESVLSEARRQLRDSDVTVDNGDSMLRVFMTLERKGSGNVLHLSAMIFIDEGDNQLRRIWEQSDEVGGVAQRMLSRGQLPPILEGNIESFFRRMRQAVMSAQRDARKS